MSSFSKHNDFLLKKITNQLNVLKSITNNINSKLPNFALKSDLQQYVTNDSMNNGVREVLFHSATSGGLYYLNEEGDSVDVEATVVDIKDTINTFKDNLQNYTHTLKLNTLRAYSLKYTDDENIEHDVETKITEIEGELQTLQSSIEEIETQVDEISASLGETNELTAEEFGLDAETDVTMTELLLDCRLKLVLYRQKY